MNHRGDLSPNIMKSKDDSNSVKNPDYEGFIVPVSHDCSTDRSVSVKQVLHSSSPVSNTPPEHTSPSVLSKTIEYDHNEMLMNPKRGSATVVSGANMQITLPE